MAHHYETIKYTRTKIKQAGKKYVSPSASQTEKDDALVLINNWRSAHSFPMQIIYVHLKKSAPENSIVAQRLKRIYSITQKLCRFPNMSLTSMQDIGGCRVIVNSIDEVYALVTKLKNSRMRHNRKEEYDYIKSPKPDGYRSYHLVLSYQSDRNASYNGLFIEIQIRTHLQHVWGTAVETMDTFTGDPIKIGQGSPENREFFRLVSKLFEQYEKNDYDINSVKDSAELHQLQDFSKTNDIIQKMKTIQRVADYVSSIDKKEQGYYVLRLNRKSSQLTINPFDKTQNEEATTYYDLAEKNRTQFDDIVLVSTTSFSNLQQAYPNYFTDVSEFVRLLEKMLN